MRAQIPRPALLLGLAGLLPFLCCVMTGFFEVPAFVQGWEDLIMLRYGIVILSVIPALWAFFTTMGPTPQALAALMAGFVGLLGLDWVFWRLGLAPEWWMRLRLILTSGVMASLAFGLYL